MGSGADREQTARNELERELSQVEEIPSAEEETGVFPMKSHTVQLFTDRTRTPEKDTKRRTHAVHIYASEKERTHERSAALKMGESFINCALSAMEALGLHCGYSYTPRVCGRRRDLDEIGELQK